MPVFNYASRELVLKIVYYGPALCGKTTNLEYIYQSLPEDKKGKMLSLSTETDRTLFFDFLPLELGTVKEWRLRIQLYTVPGQVFYDATRRLVLKGADGVVFVADSQKEMLEANIESWQNMKENLAHNGLDFWSIPLVVQYNKRDLKNILPVDVLEQRINERNAPSFEAIAIEGQGVMETLQEIIRLTLQSVQERIARPEEMAPAKTASEGVQEIPVAAPETTESIPAEPSPTPEPSAPEPVEAPAGEYLVSLENLDEVIELQPLEEVSLEEPAAQSPDVETTSVGFTETPSAAKESAPSEVSAPTTETISSAPSALTLDAEAAPVQVVVTSTPEGFQVKMEIQITLRFIPQARPSDDKET